MSLNAVWKQARAEATLVRRGAVHQVARDLGGWLWSNSSAVLLRRDLRQPITVPPARLELAPRPFESRDISLLYPDDLDGQDLVEALRSRKVAELGLPDRWVFVDEDDRPCYFQWIALPGTDPRVADFFGIETVELARGQGLLEGAWTPVAQRGRRITPHAMSRLCEIYRDRGFDYLYTFIGIDNQPALKAARGVGFVDHLARDGAWRLGRYRVTYSALATDGDGP